MRTAFWLVNTTQSYSASAPSAPWSADGSSGSMRIADSSSTSAPSAARASRRPVACADARVTTTLRPNKGRWSNQAISWRSDTTLPMTVITGADSPARVIASASVATVASTVRWRACVPHCTAAAGMSGDMPPATSAVAMRGSDFTPM